ncbi:hypothetical protein AB4Y95_02130 [Arthrobacter sp. M-10]|uniref:hypothetical protein n=1 Tax=Arthrobacter sp. M-10 TaxID=3233037 RepID=UPI003F8F0C7C
MSTVTKEAQLAGLHMTIRLTANQLRRECDARIEEFAFRRLRDVSDEASRFELVRENAFRIFGSEVFVNVRARAVAEENPNELVDPVFRNIEGSTIGAESQKNFKGLSDDVNSNKLGSILAQQNQRLRKFIDAIGGFRTDDVQAFGSAYEYTIKIHADASGQSGGKFRTSASRFAGNGSHGAKKQRVLAKLGEFSERFFAPRADGGR